MFVGFAVAVIAHFDHLGKMWTGSTLTDWIVTGCSRLDPAERRWQTLLPSVAKLHTYFVQQRDPHQARVFATLRQVFQEGRLDMTWTEWLSRAPLETRALFPPEEFLGTTDAVARPLVQLLNGSSLADTHLGSRQAVHAIYRVLTDVVDTVEVSVHSLGADLDQTLHRIARALAERRAQLRRLRVVLWRSTDAPDSDDDDDTDASGASDSADSVGALTVLERATRKLHHALLHEDVQRCRDVVRLSTVSVEGLLSERERLVLGIARVPDKALFHVETLAYLRDRARRALEQLRVVMYEERVDLFPVLQKFLDAPGAAGVPTSLRHIPWWTKPLLANMGEHGLNTTFMATSSPWKWASKSTRTEDLRFTALWEAMQRITMRVDSVLHDTAARHDMYRCLGDLAKYHMSVKALRDEIARLLQSLVRTSKSRDESQCFETLLGLPAFEPVHVSSALREVVPTAPDSPVTPVLRKLQTKPFAVAGYSQQYEEWLRTVRDELARLAA